MYFEEIYETPKKAVQSAIEHKPYIIKVKCLACKEASWINDPEKILIVEDFLIIEHPLGKVSYPIQLIEKITIRYRDYWLGKKEVSFEVSASHLKQFLSDESRDLLKKHNLL